MKYRVKVEHTAECIYEFEAPEGLTQDELEKTFWDTMGNDENNCINHDIAYYDGAIYGVIVPVE